MSDNKSMAGRVFQLIAGDPALDLVNTVDWRFRKGASQELLTRYEDLLAFAEQTSLLSRSSVAALRNTIPKSAATDLRSVRELRELCAEVFYAFVDGKRPPADAVSALERRFQAARMKQQLAAEKGALVWTWGRAEEVPELLPSLLALRAEALLTSREALENVRACGEPECRWLFLDQSKNHTRRWCDMKICGNRVKARRFKAQHYG